MTDQQRATTIERGYAGVAGLREDLPTTTAPLVYHFVVGQRVPTYRSDRPMHVSTASLLQEYLEQVATKPSAAMIEAGFLFVPAPEEPVPRADFAIGSLQQPRAVRSRHERHARLIALIESWLADESGYDETVWPRLKARIEESRTSNRKRFSD